MSVCLKCEPKQAHTTAAKLFGAPWRLVLHLFGKKLSCLEHLAIVFTFVCKETEVKTHIPPADLFL